MSEIKDIPLNDLSILFLSEAYVIAVTVLSDKLFVDIEPLSSEILSQARDGLLKMSREEILAEIQKAKDRLFVGND